MRQPNNNKSKHVLLPEDRTSTTPLRVETASKACGQWEGGGRDEAFYFWRTRNRWGLQLKRLTDVLLSAVGLLILSPVIVILSLLIYRKLGAPVFFKQRRPGRFEKSFTMVKFRTMSALHDAEGRLLHDRDRLTDFGAFLRRTSLDELPELFNVLRGDMSLVGPRPLLEQYLPWYRPEERCRHWVRPGITGLAQIRGRNRVAWDLRLSFDVQYVREWSLGLDLRILAATVRPVLHRHGVVVVPDDSMLDLDAERRSAGGTSGTRQAHPAQ